MNGTVLMPIHVEMRCHREDELNAREGEQPRQGALRQLVGLDLVLEIVLEAHERLPGDRARTSSSGGRVTRSSREPAAARSSRDAVPRRCLTQRNPGSAMR